MLALRSVKNLIDNCKTDQQAKFNDDLRLSQINTSEAHLYFDNDHFKGLLVSFSLFAQRRYFSYEILASPVDYFTVLRRPGPMYRLISLKVSRERSRRCSS